MDKRMSKPFCPRPLICLKNDLQIWDATQGFGMVGRPCLVGVVGEGAVLLGGGGEGWRGGGQRFPQVCHSLLILRYNIIMEYI